MVESFSNLTLEVAEGNTVSSIELLSEKTFVDIGSGTVLRLYWYTPAATGNSVDYYNLFINTCDNTTGIYKTLLDASIGNVNEFYVTSELLSQVAADHYQINVKLTAVSKYGKTYNGETPLTAINISKGCGTYIKVTDGFSQPIMKRALAFAKLGYVALKDTEGKALKDADGKVLYAKMARTQDVDTGWTLMQEFYSKDPSEVWHDSDIRYEVLTDADGEIITDSDDEPIYVL